VSDDDRAARRRAEREAKRPKIIVGEGIIAKPVPDATYEAKPFAELPEKQPGEHRWVASATYVINMSQVWAARDPDIPKFLDAENLFFLGVGCWDCEQPLGVIQPDSRCPSPGSE
jgi:hypothetical protein